MTEELIIFNSGETKTYQVDTELSIEDISKSLNSQTDDGPVSKFWAEGNVLHWTPRVAGSAGSMIIIDEPVYKMVKRQTPPIELRPTKSPIKLADETALALLRAGGTA